MFYRIRNRDISLSLLIYRMDPANKEAKEGLNRLDPSSSRGNEASFEIGGEEMDLEEEEDDDVIDELGFLISHSTPKNDFTFDSECFSEVDISNNGARVHSTLRTPNQDEDADQSCCMAWATNSKTKSHGTNDTETGNMNDESEDLLNSVRVPLSFASTSETPLPTPRPRTPMRIEHEC